MVSGVVPVQIQGLKLTGLSGHQQYEAWKLFKFQFENYVLATNSDKETNEARKTALLLHLMGPDVIPIFQSFDKKVEDSKLSDVITLFNNYFSPKKNTALERQKFLSRRQRPGESLDTYLTDLKNLASACELGTLQDSLVKDLFILGLRDEYSYIKEQLLQKGEELKKLEDLMNVAKTMEMARNPEKTLESHQEGYDVMKVSHQSRHSHQSRSNQGYSQLNASKHFQSSNQFKYHNNRPSNPQQSFNMSTSKQCGNCGQFHRYKCPAYNASCNLCHRRGHYAKMCRSCQQVKLVNQHQQAEEDNVCESEYFVGSVNRQEDNEDSAKSKWTVPGVINNKISELCIDTGAEANVMSLSTFLGLGLHRNIIKPTVSRLTSYGGTDIPISGHCILNLKIKDVKLPTRFFVCNNSDQPTLIGSQTSEKFNLIKRICKVENPIFGSYNDFMLNYQDLFEGLGCLPGTCHITLKENAVPHIDPPRRVPFKLLSRYKAELKRMCDAGVIEKINEPTEWLNSVCIVEKPDKSLRVCLDPQPLNREIVRARYQLPTIEDIRNNLLGASCFSKLDASSAFWSMKLDKESQDYCTFGSPVGRFKFLRMPYGISCAPEKFHQKLTELLSDLDGVICYIDDILIFGKNKQEHDSHLKMVLDKIRKINLKLNKQKCQIGLNKISFLGQVFQASGMSPEFKKIEAIMKMSEPTSVKELQRFLGMINYLSGYLPNMSEKCANLRKLLKKHCLWSWENVHQREFDNLKQLICNSPVLKFFDVNSPIVLNVDCSQFAAGACLLQENKPVAYASKSLTETQRRWAQIEKELFAIWFGCEKFHQYVYGQRITVETDHKPLITLFKKSLADIPCRLQRLMMKLQKYDLKVVYKSGKEMYVSDTLSRAPLSEECLEFDSDLEQELTIHANMYYRSVNASDQKLKEIAEVTKSDSTLLQVMNYIRQGWPKYKNLTSKAAQSFYMYRQDLHIVNDVIFKNNSVVVPFSLQSKMLKDVHLSHQGYNKTKNFIKNVIFWPTLYDDLRETILNCQVCQKYKPSNPREPLMPHEVPTHPWEKVGVDLFDFCGSKYLIIVDYYSKFFETILLSNAISQTIIKHFKSVFSRQGIPSQLISDGGPPFSSKELNEFYIDWNIEHKCSSPYLPRSNGLAEQTVKLIKSTLFKCKEDGTDPYLAMLHLRNSFQDGQEPPAKLLNARLLRTNLPTQRSQLKTSPIPYSKFVSMNKSRVSTMKNQYDKHAKPLPEFKLNDPVYFQKKPRDIWLPAVISKKPTDINSHRAYEIVTPEGQKFIRNRIYLRYRYNNNNSKSGNTSNAGTKIADHLKPIGSKDLTCQSQNYLFVRNDSSSIDIITESQVFDNPGNSVVNVTTQPQDSEIIDLSESLESHDDDSPTPVDLDTTLLYAEEDESSEEFDDSVSDPTWNP